MDIFRVLINERPSELCFIDQNFEEVHNLQSPEERKNMVLLSALLKRFGVSRMRDFQQTRCSRGCSINSLVSLHISVQINVSSTINMQRKDPLKSLP